ncbi:hypothetical protein HMPREF0379_0875 [[Eubacterium] yurii subsp. margaretiae ATCC 43715]|nr:hypothetical protein HMPREF0379_0875 [[Eubacterium] yurii subsp. margaretiae ATCC 43715]
MENIKNRLDELELRLQKLEHEIQILRNEQKKEMNKDMLFSNVNQTSQAVLQAKSKPEIQLKEKFEKADDSDKKFSKKSSLEKEIKSKPFLKKSEDNESLVGKYLVGALASLLIFIAATSFVAIVWNKISPEIKLSVVGITGLVLTVYGFKMTLTKASNISSIVLGTGIGLVYIAIVSASLVFLLISHELSALLSVIWSLIILFSYRYTKLYFTIIISAIGSFINLCFELNYIDSHQDIMLIIVHTTVVIMMLLYMSKSLDKNRNALSIFFAFFNFALIFIVVFFTWDLEYSFALTTITIIMLIISNWMYRLANREGMKGVYLIFTIISTLFLFLDVYFRLSYALDLTSLQKAFILFIIILTQILINNIFYPKIENAMTMFYTIPLYFLLISINGNLFDFRGMGALTIMLLFILRKKITKKLIVSLYMIVLVFFDFCLSYGQNNVFTLLFMIGNLILMFYILHYEETENIIYKNIAVAILLLSYYKISGIIFHLIDLKDENYEIQDVVAYLLNVITIIFLYKISYLESKDEKKSHLHKHLGLYIFSILLYLFGMGEMLEVKSTISRFIVAIIALVISMFQTNLLLKDYKEIPNHIGIWIVVKYFIFSWVTLRAFSELPFESVSYSVVGLLLAIVAIYAGFRRNIRVIRQFGLCITMLMVAKFIFVDLQGENSITRVIAFAIGGVLCFIISIIYNRLSKE